MHAIKNSKYFVLWKKSIATHWKVCQKRAAPRWVNLVVQWLPQGFMFFLSLSSSIRHGLTLFPGQLSLWISSVVPWRPDKFHERRGTTLSSLPFKGVEERGDRHFSQKPPECSMSLLTRLVHVLILRLSTDKQEETITASQRSTRSYGRLLNKIHVLRVGKSSLDICWVGTTFKMRQRKTMGDKLQTA